MLDGIGQSLKEEKISFVIDNLDQGANDAAVYCHLLVVV